MLSDKSFYKSLIGSVYSSIAFLIWGLSPLYWKNLKIVPAFEILMHRIVWSFVFLVPLLIFQKRWEEFTDTLKDSRSMMIFLFTTFLVGYNWFLFIWAINHDRILETSLGYYINPLINVLLGMLFLKEKLRLPQIISVILASIGVIYLTAYYGKFPWIALTLAVTFGLYGLIRKILAVGSLIGLSVETFILGIPASLYLFYLYFTNSGGFLNISIKTDVLLAASAMVTAFPLLLFTMGARRITLIALGFLQYISPSCTFLLAVFYYNEPFSKAQLITFILIWSALAVYTIDSISFYRKKEGLNP